MTHPTHPFNGPTAPMEITIRPTGRFAEVRFTDSEDHERCAMSGLLDANERLALAYKLRGIAKQLEEMPP